MDFFLQCRATSLFSILADAAHLWGSSEAVDEEEERVIHKSEG